MRKSRERKERFAELAGDLKNPRVVPAIDAALEEMIQDFVDLYGLRDIAARRHKVNSLPPAMPMLDAHLGPEVKRKNSRLPPPTEPTQELNLVAGSAADACWQIIEPRETGITHAELRKEFAKTPAGMASESGRDRPYYSAIQRLKTTGHVVLAKSRLWASHRLKKFEEDVAAKRVEDIAEQPRFHSMWQELALTFIRKRGTWVSTNEVADYMASLPEYKDNKSRFSQTAKALENLYYRHKVLERKHLGRGKGTMWRIAGTGETADTDDVDLSAELGELELPEVRH